MYYLNKLVFLFANPVSFTLILMAASIVFMAKGRRIWALGFGVAAFAWLLVFSLPVSIAIFGLPLEKEFPPAAAEESPEADAIVILGGGMAANTNSLVYAEMSMPADRVWHAARLFRTGKAPIVLATGIGEMESTLPLMRDFGIPDSAIIIENDSRNTEENAIFTERALKERFKGKEKFRILLVTSAWHMRRALLMFSRYAPALEAIPAPCDWEAHCAIALPWEPKHFAPSSGALDRNNTFLKEHIGFWGYKLLRR
ncbi:MAG: YdcF family protein [Kiritimatiellae bacterium]|nr:YdcF family protein [Kiritimatiellia bacterium]